MGKDTSKFFNRCLQNVENVNAITFNSVTKNEFHADEDSA